MIKVRNKKNKGFSIGEVLLSVFILGVVMVTILALYARGMNEFQDERDSIIAAMLAQEGVELARNIRDKNWADRECAKKADCVLSGDDFPDTFFNFAGYNTTTNQNSCRIDYNDDNLTSCGVVSKSLGFDSNGYYAHDFAAGTLATKFRRTITIDYPDNITAVVTSFVSWDNSDPPTNTSNCNVSNSCVFSQETLKDWGTGA